MFTKSRLKGQNGTITRITTSTGKRSTLYSRRSAAIKIIMAISCLLCISSLLTTISHMQEILQTSTTSTGVKEPIKNEKTNLDTKQNNEVPQTSTTSTGIKQPIKNEKTNLLGSDLETKQDNLKPKPISISAANRPKVYIHIGAPKTGTTSIQNTMVTDKSVLKEDKYYLAIHGQTKEGNPISDNMLFNSDRLAACIWSDEERKIVVQGSGDPVAGKCPRFLLPVFHEFLSKAIEAKSNMVISNEWLNRHTSAEGLLGILDGWDPIILIYYRRFFDWVISAHYQWHFDLGLDVINSLQGKVQLVDFIRIICCSRLFASTVPHSPSDADLSFVDLVDIQEYTYHAWKRYKKVPQYDNIKIINFHDGHIIKSLYCDVLGAEKACKVEMDRLAKGRSIQAQSKSSTAHLDLAIGLYWKDRKLFAASYAVADITKPTMNTFKAVAQIIKTRMAAKGMGEDDLPKECLTTSELSLLLDVSLAYEKILLPESYAIEGGLATKIHFASKKGSFCSVDLDGILTDQKWHFLFEEEKTVPT